MKIICENRKEFDELMRASKYLHDFKIIDRKGETILLDRNIFMINFLCFLHFDEKNWPEKKKFVTFEIKS